MVETLGAFPLLLGEKAGMRASNKHLYSHIDLRPL
jgi:hypothetical protein